MPSTEPRLTQGTLISISLVAAIATCIAAGASWATNISLRLVRIEEAVLSGNRNSWTIDDMDNWVRTANRDIQLWQLQVGDQLGIDPETALQLPEARNVTSR